MFGDHHLDRSRQVFANQFEADGTDLLYRKAMRGAPIRVTEEERDRFVADYSRWLGYTTWSFAAIAVVAIGLLAFFASDPDGGPAGIAVWIVVAATLIPFLLVHRWAFNAPTRELARRPVVGEQRTRADARRRALANMSYGQFAAGLGGVVFLVWKASAKNDLFHGWARLWLVFAGVMVVGIGIQAFRKWIHER